MMSDALFWWNHLTYEQRMFIEDWATRNHRAPFSVADAYESRESFHTMANWPEDKF